MRDLLDAMKGAEDFAKETGEAPSWAYVAGCVVKDHPELHDAIARFAGMPELVGMR